jgi:aspartate kinase
MKVFKLGGASISTIDRIKAAASLIKKYNGEKLLLIVSAMGKTTNALEKVSEAFYAGNKAESLSLFNEIRNTHIEVTNQLRTKNNKQQTTNYLLNYFTEVEWLLHDKPVRDYNYYYDQVVCTGELLSTCIVSNYFNSEGINNIWVDVRDILRTDNNFREARVDLEYTNNQIERSLASLFDKTNLVITQGFIGSTDENESTTLGREGSDYSAALFANMLNAESLTIWKDVEGVMSADPKAFKDAKFINALSYEEVIEMAYYGAQVIHPKTIKPLQNKNIPLYVKCFLQPDLPGTVINNKIATGLPPIIVEKDNQVLMQLSSKDYSFVGEKPVSTLYKIFADLRIKPNLTQNGAISLSLCLDDHQEKIKALALAASDLFNVHIQKGLSLLTVRHYTTEILTKLLDNKTIMLEQRTPETVQFLLK